MENNHVDHVKKSDTFTSEKLLHFYTDKLYIKSTEGQLRLCPL